MTAIRAISADGAETATGRPEAMAGRVAVAAGLAGLVLLAVVLRLVPTVFVPSMNWGDEIFQTIEPAHRLVYGYGLVPWEFQTGMRSWLMPGFIAGLMEFARLFGDGPAYYLPVIAGAFALLASAPVLCAFLWARRFFGLAGAFVAAATVAVAPELVYFGARALSGVVAAHLFVIALYLITPGYPVGDRRRLFYAGLLFGLVGLLRLQLLPAVAVVALWPTGVGWRQRLPAVVAGGVVVVVLGAGLDWATLGYPLASIWRTLYDNAYLGVSSTFGVAPWDAYLLGEVGVWLVAAPVVLALAAFGARRLPTAAAAAVTIIAVLSVIPHKEYRFIYPAMMLVAILVGLALAQLAGAGAQELRRIGVGRAAAVALAAIVVTAGWSATSYAVWSHGTLAPLRQRAHGELVAMSFAHGLHPLCGIALYGTDAWVPYGGYTYLHRRVPMYWPADRAALARTAPAFDTFLYDTKDLPGPVGFGFKTVRCFGHICVDRRAGGCTSMPTPHMPFPKQMQASEPAPGRFEALPRSVAREP